MECGKEKKGVAEKLDMAYNFPVAEFATKFSCRWGSDGFLLLNLRWFFCRRICGEDWKVRF
jgi:hypothetical protein